jgi:uncharacterized damage-inducible protein DinB
MVGMIGIADLRTMYGYGCWANRKVFDVLRQLTPEEFTRQVAGSYGSVQSTMVHMMSAEWGWVYRCGGGESRGPALVPSDYPTVDSLAEKWSQVEGWIRDYLAKLTDEDLNRIVEFSFPSTPTYAMPVGELMQHAANHSVHHRGQVALLLRALGHVPGNFDILFYFGKDRTA